MIEAIIVPESIIPSIVWWIYIYELYFSCKSLSEWVESDEIVPFYEEILSQISIRIEKI